ncbi:MAG: hypothetical protein EHM93_00945 [Bacteroidales bacterium]|nr:MAG: hypothetical protein EHM93_00945 [Bacteroidales bacterium]
MIKRISEKTFLLEIAKITGVLLWFLLSSISWIITPKDGSSNNQILLIRLVQTLSGYIVISLYYGVFNILDRKSILSKRVFIYLLFPICFIISMFWNILGDTLGWLLKLNGLAFSNYLYLFLSALFYFIPTLAFTGLYYAIIHWLNYKRQKEKTLIATNLANETQLQMLRYQINPHFLFNALNTIRAMVEADKTIARKMITELSDFFRYSLSNNGTTETLENEINAIKNYLEIQKTRFEEKLIIEYDIDERLNNMRIPFFIILPLVENAIKFGLQTSSIPLNIRIFARINQHIEIRVSNTGSLVENTENSDCTKTGIANTKKRLELYFPNNHSFKLFEEDNWVISKIIITDIKKHLPI